VTGYLVERCQGAGCTNFNQIATPAGTTYNDTGLTAATSYSYRVRATDAAQNLSPYSNTATTSTQAADTQPPTAPGTLNATAAGSTQINLRWGAATDNVAVTGYLVERCQGAGCTNFTQIATPAGTTYNDTGLTAAISYSYRVRATDAAQNLGPYSNVATATTQASATTLVAAYSFDEGSGATVSDASGNGNNGTISGATWTASGKYGKALSFNGGSMVTIPDAASLHLSSAMTLEAWVNPTATDSSWRDVIYKGNDNYFLEGTSLNGSAPDVGGTFGGAGADVAGSSALAANTWSYLAGTYDGATLRLYVNGTQVASQARTGAIATSTNPLTIGGDPIFGQWFSGLIDEVRVYNAALTASQIQSDMLVGGNYPSTPGALAATTASASEVDLNWLPATDNHGITGYLVERCQGAGCTNFTQIATPTGTSYNDTGLSADTTYQYRVRAVNSLGNAGGYSNVAVGFTGLAISPRVTDVTFTRTQQFSAVGPGSSSATWSVDGTVGGTAASGTVTSSGLYSPPNAVGTHTVTVTSSGEAASATVYVTNYAGVLTTHNDLARTGANTNETTLTPSNVNTSSFGKLFSYPLDGLSFASPLYVANVNVPGQGFHNIVYVVTEHDSVYAYDADGLSSTPIWKDSFINPAAGVTPIPPADTGETDDIPNEIGITGTPTIDPATNTMYLVAATKEVNGGTTRYVNRLHALDITTGAEKFGGPIVIDAHVPGTGVDAVNGVISFNNITENQRAGLTLANGELYIAFANHGFNPPYHGWLMAYNPSTLHQDWVFCTTPNSQSGGIWMGGGGIGVDASGSLYFSTGNGTFDANTGKADYGDSLVKLNQNGAVSDYFTPYNYQSLDNNDIDLASGGILLLPDQPGTHPHEVIAAGKGGTVYVVDRDSMGHVGSGNDNQIVQSLINVFPTGGSYNTGNYSAPVYFNGAVYYAPVSGQLMRFSLSNGRLSTSPTSVSPETYQRRGGAMSISANGTSSGILWALQTNGGVGVLRAYDPANLANELYTSDQAGARDTLGGWMKFSPPVIANGHVYVASSTALVGYGLLP
jgi:chitodextrinase